MPGDDAEMVGRAMEDSQRIRETLSKDANTRIRKSFYGLDAIHCAQCNVDCVACAKGEIHMNIELPWPGYTHGSSHQVDWSEHNAKGHHHVIWNGAHNEVLPCGSQRVIDLVARSLKEAQAIKASSANARQVGGQHYGLSDFQHWDMVDLFGLDYFQGQITKYVMRWKKKNGLQDLDKARHFLDKYIELEKLRTTIKTDPRKISSIEIVSAERPE